MLNGSAQNMAGSSMPLMSFRLRWKGVLEIARRLHVSRRLRQASRRLRLFYWVAPLWGLGPTLVLAGGGRLQWSGVAVAGRLVLPSGRRPIALGVCSLGGRGQCAALPVLIVQVFGL